MNRIPLVKPPLELLLPLAKKSPTGSIVAEYAYLGRTLIDRKGIVSQGGICAFSWFHIDDERRLKFSLETRTERAALDIDLPEQRIFSELLFPGEISYGEDSVSYSEKDWEIR
nr:hypothetical protein MarFTME_439 [Marseillevirus futianmevirus]